MMYVDSNIFFYAKIMDKKYGKACAKIVEEIAEGKIKVSISPLVILEVANALRKFGFTDEIKEVADAILSLDIQILPLDEIIIRMTVEIFERAKISPYDCVHAAIMKRYGIKEILSADKEFDKVPNIKRLDPLKWNPSK